MATSKLQSLVKRRLIQFLPTCQIYENIRPSWLECEGSRLELDIYIPKANIAIEVQGQQHYVFTPRFHRTEDDFKSQQHRDSLKRIRCEEIGLTLYEVSSESDIDHYLSEIIYKLKKINPISIENDWHIARWKYVVNGSKEIRDELFNLVGKNRHQKNLLRDGNKRITPDKVDLVRHRIKKRRKRISSVWQKLRCREGQLIHSFERMFGKEPYNDGRKEYAVGRQRVIQGT